MKNKFTILFLVSYIMSLFLFGFYIQRSQSAEDLNMKILEVTVTAYSPSPHVTDNTPFEMASGKIATPQDLEQLRYIAVSRDLIEKYNLKWGSIVYIGFELQDKMGTEVVDGADIFMRSLDLAQKFGRQKREIIILK